MAALGTNSKPSMPQPKGSSMPQYTAVGSGSRPGTVRVPIPDSAPKDAHGLDGRMTPAWLGSGSAAKPQGY